MRELGKKIKALRATRGMTQDAFAERLHVTRQTVSNYENGRSQPDLKMLQTIAQVLDTDVNTLLGAESTAAPQARKRDIRRLMISSMLLAALLAAGILLKHWADAQWHDFLARPRMLMLTFYYPSVWALGGWCGMQALGVFLGLRPLQRPWCRYARRAVFVLMLSFPFLLGGLWLNGVPLPEWLWMFYVNIVKKPALFAIFGMVLWGWGFFSAKQENPTA